MLLLKKRLFYRPTNLADRQADKSCGTCKKFRPAHPIYRIGGEKKGDEPRCETIGLDNSIRYRVRKDHVCTSYLRKEVTNVQAA